MAMSTLQQLSTAAITALMLGTMGASAGEQPQYEVAGFPISPHQISVLGSRGIQEQSPTPTLTLNGMPASPHQIAVIRPRTKQHISKKLNKDAPDASAQKTN
jgi:hypothetical protein